MPKEPVAAACMPMGCEHMAALAGSVGSPACWKEVARSGEFQCGKQSAFNGPHRKIKSKHAQGSVRRRAELHFVPNKILLVLVLGSRGKERLTD